MPSGLVLLNCRQGVAQWSVAEGFWSGWHDTARPRGSKEQGRTLPRWTQQHGLGDGCGYVLIIRGYLAPLTAPRRHAIRLVKNEASTAVAEFDRVDRARCGEANRTNTPAARFVAVLLDTTPACAADMQSATANCECRQKLLYEILMSLTGNQSLGIRVNAAEGRKEAVEAVPIIKFKDPVESVCTKEDKIRNDILNTWMRLPDSASKKLHEQPATVHTNSVLHMKVLDVQAFQYSSTKCIQLAAGLKAAVTSHRNMTGEIKFDTTRFLLHRCAALSDIIFKLHCDLEQHSFASLTTTGARRVSQVLGFSLHTELCLIDLMRTCSQCKNDKTNGEVAEQCYTICTTTLPYASSLVHQLLGLFRLVIRPDIAVAQTEAVPVDSLQACHVVRVETLPLAARAGSSCQAVSMQRDRSTVSGLCKQETPSRETSAQHRSEPCHDVTLVQFCQTHDVDLCLAVTVDFDFLTRLQRVCASTNETVNGALQCQSMECVIVAIANSKSSENKVKRVCLYATYGSWLWCIDAEQLRFADIKSTDRALWFKVAAQRQCYYNCTGHICGPLNVQPSTIDIKHVQHIASCLEGAFLTSRLATRSSVTIISLLRWLNTEIPRALLRNAEPAYAIRPIRHPPLNISTTERSSRGTVFCKKRKRTSRVLVVSVSRP